jgi:hypothetical protein
MKKENMEMIVSLLSLKEDVNNVCPRCGGRLYPENQYPYGGGLSVSRLCAVSICPKCGMEEALSDWNRSGGRSTEDFQRYVSGELQKWYAFRQLLERLHERSFRAVFIQSMESNLYSGTNTDGNEVRVLLEQGKGMEVKTRHKEKPRWYECIHYDACGYQEGVTYESLGDKL